MASDDVSVSSVSAPATATATIAASLTADALDTASAAQIVPGAPPTPPFPPTSLSRSVSQQSSTSTRSRRSARAHGNGGRRGSSRVPAGLANQQLSASASSSASDDNKSLTSFPSFSPEGKTAPASRPRRLGAAASLSDSQSLSKSSSVDSLTAAALPQRTPSPSPLTVTGPAAPTASASSVTVASAASSSSAAVAAARNALFEDAPPLPNSKVVPGALHLTDDAHIARIIGKHGAVNLVRQLAEDLALRDAQIAALRARAADRERALRKIVLECGLSSLDLETRLRAVEQEQEARAQQQLKQVAEGTPLVSPTAGIVSGSHRVSDLVSDAMADDHSLHRSASTDYFYAGATIRASSTGSGGSGGLSNKTSGTGTSKGWKDYLWGAAKKNSQPSSSSAHDETSKLAASSTSSLVDQQPSHRQRTAVRIGPASADRRPPISDDLFSPPRPPMAADAGAADAGAAETGGQPASSASSVRSAGGQAGRKASLASLALRFVVGGNGSSTPPNEGGQAASGGGMTVRGRAETASASAASASLRAASSSRRAGAISARSARAATLQSGPKSLMSMRRTSSVAVVPQAIPSAGVGGGHGGAHASSVRGQAQERWGEMMESLPNASGFTRQETYGPVEMDTILPMEVQPPTLTNMYNRYNSSQYLIDRFGFIYDQRRKKRQRDAARVARHIKHRSRNSEMLSNGRNGRSTPSLLFEPDGGDDDNDDDDNDDNVSPSAEANDDNSNNSNDSGSLRGRANTGSISEIDAVPDSPPTSLDDGIRRTNTDGKEAQPKRWQDYLRIATFPTELLSHTPAMSDPRIEIIADDGPGNDNNDAHSTHDSTNDTANNGTLTPPSGGDATAAGPKSPGFLMPGGRGIAPSTGTTAAPSTAETTTTTPSGLDTDSIASGTTEATTDSRQPAAQAESQTHLQLLKRKHRQQQNTAATLVKEDVEPVRLLLLQLSELHDKLQKERMVRWGEFLRKVRAERRREGEVAAATAAAAAEARFLKATAVMPETRLIDGEIVGVAGLGNKGKLGRAKWNEFRMLVLGGIPVALRAKVWAECTGANNLRVPGAYEDLVAGRGDDGQVMLEGGGGGAGAEAEDRADVVAQIQADIYRTLTDNIFFRDGPGTAKLNEVLLAYARRNPEVGYCQGMNLIAANLLLVAPSAEDAFWLLASIIETILPAGYYDHSLLASRADQQVLRGYVAEVLPRLSGHFDALAIDLETMTFQWFLSVFTDCLSAEALFRVWDVVLCLGDGSVFLFQVALALLKLNEAALLRCDTPAAVYTYINHQMTNHAISIDGLIQASEALRKLVRRDDVEARRAQAVDAERALVAARAAAVREAQEARRQRQDKAAAAAAAAAAKRADDATAAASVKSATIREETIPEETMPEEPAPAAATTAPPETPSAVEAS